MTTQSFFFIGLHNLVTDGKEWFHLLFYDIDMPRGNSKSWTKCLNHYAANWLRHFSLRRKLSYVLYTTKHGAHYISLTPLNVTQWAVWFNTLDNHFDNFYSGHTIRLSPKSNESQELISYEDQFPVASGVAKIFEYKFKIKFKNKVKLRPLPEKYWSPNG